MLKLLRGTSPHKATEPDEIPGRLLKTLSDEVVEIICLIFQASLDQGRIPTAWKQAYISPIFKKGDSHKPSNYKVNELYLLFLKFSALGLLQDIRLLWTGRWDGL